MKKTILGGIIGFIFGLLCFGFLVWIGWMTDVNYILLFLLGVVPPFVAGIICGIIANRDAESIWWIIKGILITTLVTGAVGFGINVIHSIYWMFFAEGFASGIPGALILSLLFGGGATVVIVIVIGGAGG